MRNALQSLALLVISCTCLSVAQAGDPAYRWRDANGQIHFGQTPPAGVKAIPLPQHDEQSNGIGDNIPELPSYDAKQEAANERVRKAVARQNAERERRCSYLRNNLAQMISNPRVRVNKNGVATRLSEDERQNLMARTEQQIKDNCNDN